MTNGMVSYYLEYKNARIHCLHFGHGPELLIALHGFGDRARMFAVLAEALAPNYTVVAVDLPFHGQTEWPFDSFQKTDLIAIVRMILHREKRERFALMGFSFGARLAQALLPEFIDRLDKLYLLSPDGINTRGMRTAVHTPAAIRRLLYRALRRPEWFLTLVRLGGRLRLVPPLIQHFLAMNLTRPDRFRRAFGCWFALSSFYLRRRHIQALLLKSGLPTEVYFGTRDQMIRFKTVKKMADKLPNVHLRLLDEGHRVVGEELREKIRRTGDGGR